jgi:hypothetical protein
MFTLATFMQTMAVALAAILPTLAAAQIIGALTASICFLFA